jgi:hypothetical protein
METVSTSETSVNFYETAQLNVPEDSHLHVKFSMNYYLQVNNYKHGDGANVLRLNHLNLALSKRVLLEIMHKIIIKLYYY